MSEGQQGSIYPKGVIFAVGAAVLFGISPPLAKLLMGRVEPVLLAGLFYLGSGLGLSIWWLIRDLTGTFQICERWVDNYESRLIGGLPWFYGGLWNYPQNTVRRNVLLSGNTFS